MSLLQSPALRIVVTLEQMTAENYQNLLDASNKNKFTSFDQVVAMYGCDLCKKACNSCNPIYTNNKYQGLDICTQCITNAFCSYNKPIRILKDAFIPAIMVNTYPHLYTKGPNNWMNETLYSLNHIVYFNSALPPDQEMMVYNNNILPSDKIHLDIDCFYTSYNQSGICMLERKSLNLEFYCCNICEETCNKNNPIFTDDKMMDINICLHCLENAFKQGIKPVDDKDLYSLIKIVSTVNPSKIVYILKS